MMPSVQTLIDRSWPAGSIDPRRCVFRPDRPKAVVNGLTHADARALVAEGVVKNDWRGRGDVIAISAEDIAALAAFCQLLGGTLAGRRCHSCLMDLTRTDVPPALSDDAALVVALVLAAICVMLMVIGADLK
jgi:hypothetical protein